MVLRVWYILSGRHHARIFILTVFFASVVVSLRDFSTIVPSVGRVSNIGLPLGGCPAPPIANIWTIFLPYLVTQTVLFIATLWPSFKQRRRGHSSQIMGRLVREYVVVLLPQTYILTSKLSGSVFYSAFFGVFACSLHGIQWHIIVGAL